MYSGIGAYVRSVINCHVTGQRGAIGHDHLITQATIMSDVSLGHDQTIVTDLSEQAAAFGAAVNGDKLAYSISLANASLGKLTFVFEILRCQFDGNERKNVCAFAHHRAPIDDAMGLEPNTIAQLNFIADY